MDAKLSITLEVLLHGGCGSRAGRVMGAGLHGCRAGPVTRDDKSIRLGTMEIKKKSVLYK